MNKKLYSRFIAFFVVGIYLIGTILLGLEGYGIEEMGNPLYMQEYEATFRFKVFEVFTSLFFIFYTFNPIAILFPFINSILIFFGIKVLLKNVNSKK